MRPYLTLATFLVWCSCTQPFAQELSLETSIQTGHYEQITAIKFSDDGNYVVSGSRDQTAKVWEIATGREIRTFMGSPEAIKTLDISADGKRLITVCGDSLAWLWEVATGKLIRKVKDEGDIINNAIFSHDGSKIITAGKNHYAKIWDATTGDSLRSFKDKRIGCYSGRCRVSLDLSKDGKFLLTGIGDRRAVLWDFNTGERINTYKGNRGSCSSCMTPLSFSADGKTFITAAYSDSIRIWQRNRVIQTKVLGPKESHEEVKLMPDNRHFLVMARGELRYFDMQGKELWKRGEYSNGIRAFDLSDDGKSLVVGGDDREIKILNLGDGSIKTTLRGLLQVRNDSLNSSQSFWVKNLNKQAISPDGKYLAQGKVGNSAILWDLNTGRIVKELVGHSKAVVDIEFSPDGKYLATAGLDRLAKLWDVETGEEVKTFKGHVGMIFSLAFDKTGKYLVTGSWDNSAIIWNVGSGRAIGRYSVHEGSPISVNVSPNGLYLITGGLDKKLKMTDVDTGTEVREFIGHSNHVIDIEFSPDGRYMLTASWDWRAKLWDMATGLQVTRFAGHDGAVYDIAYSKDGKFIATGSYDKTARIWDPFTGEVIQTFEGHTGAVTSVNFSPNGELLITGSRDGSTKIWDIKSGTELFAHVFTNPKDWLVKAPNGFFYATEGAKESVFFVRGMESYSIDQFYDDFFRPGLVEDIYQDKLKLNDNILDKLQESPPPFIEIISPKFGFIPEGEEVEVLLKITDNGGGIDEIKVLQNGKRVVEERLEGERGLRKGKSLYKTYNLQLVAGRNQFDVSAYSSGRIESRRRSIEFQFGDSTKLANCYILAVGINKYQNPNLNLNYAKDDAESFAKAIRQKSKKLFAKIETHLLIDDDATKKNISEKLAEIAKSASPEDVFYFYYAGHGSMVDDKFYFIPTEIVRLYDQERLQNGAIYAGEMQQWFREIKALKQMIVVDACHSGASTELLAARGAGEEKALAQLSRSAGVHVLAAAGSEQTAVEFKDLGHGLFTYLVLSALGGDADGSPRDGKITVYELKSFIDDQVPDLARKFRGTPQYPHTFSRGHDFPLVIE